MMIKIIMKNEVERLLFPIWGPKCNLASVKLVSSREFICLFCRASYCFVPKTLPNPKGGFATTTRPVSDDQLQTLLHGTTSFWLLVVLHIVLVFWLTVFDCHRWSLNFQFLLAHLWERQPLPEKQPPVKMVKHSQILAWCSPFRKAVNKLCTREALPAKTRFLWGRAFWVSGVEGPLGSSYSTSNVKGHVWEGTLH